MTVKFEEEMRKSLLNLKKELIDNINSQNNSFHSLFSSADPKDDIDIASDEIDRKMLESMSSQDINKLRSIDAALSRLDAKRFGICMQCGKKISEARLRALPYAVFCIDCQNSNER
ncbi:MAG: TraR/DksA family transcriptional regulator [Spirochaetia bacterium]|nr:TraR/DksA family transcriptional regulator [Spirochaetia bacterium]